VGYRSAHIVNHTPVKMQRVLFSKKCFFLQERNLDKIQANAKTTNDETPRYIKIYRNPVRCGRQRFNYNSSGLTCIMPNSENNFS